MKTQIPQKAATRTATDAALKVQLTQNYGYRFDGDSVQVNAVLALPASLSDSTYSLELWACATPCLAADPKAQPDAHCVTTLSLELPTPLIAIEHAIQVEGAARFPLQGEGFSMLLALVHISASGARSVEDIGKFSGSQSFPSLRVSADAQYRVQANDVVLDVPRIDNDRAFGNQSGSLLIELRAFATKLDVSAANAEAGHLLATLPLSSVSGGYFLPNVSEHLALSAPPVGSYAVALLLKEWTQAFGFATRDVKHFAARYEVAAPGVAVVNAAASVNSPAAASAVAVPAKAVAAVETAPKAAVAEAPVATKTVETAPAKVVVEAPTSAVAPSAAPVSAVIPAKAAVAEETTTAAASAASAASLLLSLQSASVEELAQLEGLNERLAKEIVKARPISSFNDLLKLRGIGERMLQKLKSQITL